MHLSTCSEIDLDADILTWSGQGWTGRGRAQSGKLRVLLGKVRESSMGKGASELGVLQDSRSSLALPSKHGEEVSALVEGSSQVARPEVVEAGRGRSGQNRAEPGTRSRSWVYFHSGSLSTFCHCLQPRRPGPPSF